MNVTKATIANVTDVLKLAAEKKADVIVLSEIHALSTKPRWLLRLAAENGWGVA